MFNRGAVSSGAASFSKITEPRCYVRGFRSKTTAMFTCLLTFTFVLAAFGSGTSGGSPSGAGSHSTLKIGLITEATGDYSSVYLPIIAGTQAAFKQINAAGGANGHKLSLKVYDSQSTVSGVEAATRQALSDNVFAILAASEDLDTVIPLLVSRKVPVIGWGVTPGWYGPGKENLFSFTGDIIDYTFNSIVTAPLAQGRKKMAVIADPTPGDQAAAVVWEKMVKHSGGDLVYTNLDLDATDIASIDSIAQAAMAKGAQVILSTSCCGAADLQAAINQLGGNIEVLTSSEYGQQIQQQYGKSADGLLAILFYASLEHTSTPGLKVCKAAMKSIGANYLSAFAPYGYIDAEVLAQGLDAIKTKSVTPANLITAMNHMTTTSLGGLIVPATWPKAHTQLIAKWSFSQMQNGKWAPFGPPFPSGEAYP